MKLEIGKMYDMVEGISPKKISIKILKRENGMTTYEKYADGELDGVYEMENRNFYINAGNFKDFY